MINTLHISGIQRFLSKQVLLLLLSATVFSSSTFGHAGLHHEVREITLLIQQDPANAQLYLQRGNLYRLLQNWDDALTDFHKAQQLGTTDTSVELGLGRVLLGQGLPHQAITHLDHVLVRQPGDVRALVARAQAYRALGKPLAAAADYNRVIEHAPETGKPLPEFYLERARAYAAAGDPYIDKALQGLDEGLQVLGNVQTLALYAVELEKQRGNFDAALTRLDPILARANRKEFLLLERGDILVLANRHQEAQQTFLAAQVAIAGLPAARRHSRSVQQLEAAITARLQSTGLQDDHEQ